MKFQRGNPGGKKGVSGRKSKAEEMGLKALLDDCFTEQERRDCLTRLKKDALSRRFDIRHEARKLLLAYTYGRPTERREITGAGGESLFSAFDELQRRLARLAASEREVSDPAPPERE